MEPSTHSVVKTTRRNEWSKTRSVLDVPGLLSQFGELYPSLVPKWDLTETFQEKVKRPGNLAKQREIITVVPRVCQDDQSHKSTN